ncbi:MAG: hypothetical protein CMP11_09300 [Zetaproteobacteria bacterium]|nr:hypothetical protein [Pseudobdellovibrionaceae bacterium]
MIQKITVLFGLAILSFNFSCTTRPYGYQSYDSEDLVESFLQTDHLSLSSQEVLKKVELEEEEDIDQSLFFADHQDKELVEKWIKYYTESSRSQFDRFLTNGLYYKSMIQSLLKAQGIPTYFYYMAMIESGFKNKAVSHKNAVGIWQFMAPTARSYGLRVDRYVDERQDPIRATIAAAHYLKDLHNVFHSWFLAMAAYNAGQSRIMNAIMKHGSRDYWELVKMKAIPRETRDYIPKFIAAFMVGAHPDKYGFSMPNVKSMPELVSINVPSPVRLDDISKSTGIPSEELKSFNPHLLLGITPAYTKTYRVWFQETDQFSKNAYERSVASLRPIVFNDEAPDYYKIRRGDSLYSISRKFKIPLITIKKINGLKSNRIIAGKKILVRLKTSYDIKKYRVKRGDNLTKLAKRYRTSVSKIKRQNRLKNSRIYVGQILKI